MELGKIYEHIKKLRFQEQHQYIIFICQNYIKLCQLLDTTFGIWIHLVQCQVYITPGDPASMCCAFDHELAAAGCPVLGHSRI